jgi:hypothetical protein
MICPTSCRARVRIAEPVPAEAPSADAASEAVVGSFIVDLL